MRGGAGCGKDRFDRRWERGDVIRRSEVRVGRSWEKC